MPHISRRAIACATLASSLAAAICLAVAAPRLSAGSESPFVGFPCPSNAALTCVMKQLDGVRGLAFGPDGALYVAEAGHGGSGPCITESGARVCYGPSGAITRLWADGQERILTGLPSLAVNDPLTPGRTGQAANGPTDVSFPHHSGEDQDVEGDRDDGFSMYVTIGLRNDPNLRPLLGEAGASFARLMRVAPNGKSRFVADLGD